MNNKIKFVYFDVGNVFLDYAVGWEKVISGNNLPSVELREAFDKSRYEIMTGMINYDDVFEEIYKDHGIDMGDDFNLLWEVTKEYGTINSTHNLAKDLSKKLKVGILSNASKNMLNYSMNHGIIPELKWDVIVDSSAVGMAKPDKEIYKYATNKSGYERNEIFFIDDKVENIKSADKFGWQTHLFDVLNPDKSVEEILTKLPR